MYTDLITYVKDTSAYVAEVEKTFPNRIIKDEKTGATIGVNFTDKAPSARKGTTTVAVMRMKPDDLAELKQLTAIKILAEVPAGDDLLAAMSAANKKLYYSVYDKTPYTVTLEDGTTQTITPPALHVSFA